MQGRFQSCFRKTLGKRLASGYVALMANASTAGREDVRPAEGRVDANVRKVVRAALAARDMTGAELGAVMGFTANQIYPRLKGTKPFTVAEVAALSKLFGLPVQTFFDGPEALFGRSLQGGAVGMRSGEDKPCCIPVRMAATCVDRPRNRPISTGHMSLVSAWTLAA